MAETKACLMIRSLLAHTYYYCAQLISMLSADDALVGGVPKATKESKATKGGKGSKGNKAAKKGSKTKAGKAKKAPCTLFVLISLRDWPRLYDLISFRTLAATPSFY